MWNQKFDNKSKDLIEALKNCFNFVININNKIKLYKALKNRDIDRLRSGGFLLINEAELQEALRIKGTYK